MQFSISALLSGVMKRCGLTTLQPLILFGCRENDSADVLLSCILNPYPKSEDVVSISGNEDIDSIYPGRVVARK